MHKRDPNMLRYVLQHYYLLCSLNQIAIVKTLKNQKLAIETLKFWKSQGILPSNKSITDMVYEFVQPSEQTWEDQRELIEMLYTPVRIEFHPDQDQPQEQHRMTLNMHANGTDMICSSTHYNNIIIFSYIDIYNRYIQSITARTARPARTIDTTPPHQLAIARFWSDIYMRHITEDFDHNHVYAIPVLQGLYQTRLITHQDLNTFWNLNNNNYNFRMHVADYVNLMDLDVVRGISQQLFELVQTICRWFAAQQVLPANGAMDVAFGAGYAGAHSIHKLDNFRKGYITSLLQQVPTLTENQTKIVEQYISNLPKIWNASTLQTDLDLRIQRAISEIQSYTMQFDPASKLSMNGIFNRVCWLLISLKDKWFSNIMTSGKYTEQEVKDSMDNRFMVPEEKELEPEDRVALQMKYLEIKQLIEEQQKKCMEDYQEAQARLRQELSDMAGTCVSGHINRIFNSLVGYVQMFSIDFASIIKDIITKYVQTHEHVDDILDGILDQEFTQETKGYIEDCMIHTVKTLHASYTKTDVREQLFTLQSEFTTFFGESVAEVQCVASTLEWYSGLFGSLF